MDRQAFLDHEIAENIAFDQIVQMLDVRTPFGKAARERMEPFLPGEEEDLREEFRRVKELWDLRQNNFPFFRILHDLLEKFKDIRRSVSETKEGLILDQVELYEIKVFLLLTGEMERTFRKMGYRLPEDMAIDPLEGLLDMLDIKRQRQYSFYLEDDYSPRLQELRAEIRQLEKDIYFLQKQIRERIKAETGVMPRSTGEIMVAKHEQGVIEKLENHPNVSFVNATFTNVTFRVKPSPELDEKEEQLTALQTAEEEEEYRIREILSAEVAKNADILLKNMESIGKFDLLYAKAKQAMRYNCVIPTILQEEGIRIRDGVHPIVDRNLQKKGRRFVPVNIELEQGVAVITGANMGGKTVTLKTIALLTAMAQYGFLVPAREMELALRNFIFFSGGDYQSIDEGLSTFGAEIQWLKASLAHKDEKGLFLIDELARGTNPIEGYAIAAALVEHLEKSRSITVITTHYEGLDRHGEIDHWQVVGLKNADFDELLAKMNNRDKRSSLELLHEYMDYRLEKVGAGYETPKDALNVARLIGLDEEIISLATRILEDTGKRKEE